MVRRRQVLCAGCFSCGNKSGERGEFGRLFRPCFQILSAERWPPFLAN